jgi:diaminopimelate epimerase
MRIDFTKMHGLGNDVIVFGVPAASAIPASEVFRELGDRRTGIGFDQAMVLLPPRQPGTDLYYRIFNSDGSEVEQCGNGARCVASFVAGKTHRSTLRMDSPAGVIEAQVLADNSVSLDMGVPNFAPSSLPFDAPAEADIYRLQVGDREIEVGAVSMGNPHVTLRVQSVDAASVETLGPQIENHSRFAQRVNAGFMEIVDAGHIRLRVYERGAGETLACGTGACAAVAIAKRWGVLRAESVRVDARGGRMEVRWPGPGERLWLTGPAVKVFEGQVDV